jgi:hypothetical protein
MTVDYSQLAEDSEIKDYSEVVKEDARQREARRKALQEQIADNGFAMRTTLMSESVKGYYPSPLAMEEMSIEDVMVEIPAEDLLYVGTVKDHILIPVKLAQQWIVPTIRVQKALKQSQNQGLPGGMEAAMAATPSFA